MIKGDKVNWGKWKIGIIENVFKGKDNTKRSFRICTGNRVVERPIQLLYPMELHCDSKSTTSNTQHDKTLNVNPNEIQPKRSAVLIRHLICIIKWKENNMKISRSRAI